MSLFSVSFRNRMLASIAAAAVLVVAGASAPDLIGEAQAKKVVIKQTNIYVATLPTGCVKTMYGNVEVWRCGTLYYQPYKGRYVRVYIN